MAAKQRKRDAVGNLRELATELGVAALGREGDLSKDDFIKFHSSVAAKGATPEHKERLDAAMQLYLGGATVLPALPLAPPLPGLVSQPTGPQAGSQAAAAAESSTSQVAADGFRLRSSACLFTWNSTEKHRNGETERAPFGGVS